MKKAMTEKERRRIQELNMLRMSVRAVRAQVNRQLDAVEAHILRLLPEEKPQKKIKNFKGSFKNL